MTEQLLMHDLMDDVVADTVSRLPSGSQLAAIDVAVALNVDSSTVYEWWESGDIRGWDKGTGSRRYLMVTRQSIVEFIHRRSQP